MRDFRAHLLTACAVALLGACVESSDCKAPSTDPGGQPDTAQFDAGAPDPGAPEPDPGTPDTGPPNNCQLGLVNCAGNQSDIYGVCVTDAEIAHSGGAFKMGTSLTSYPDANPSHDVTVSSFVIDRTEVTNEMWAACVECGQCDPPTLDGSFSGREPYYGSDDYLDYPVLYVSWEQAVAFCEGLDKRLPTEAEWEIAARGTAGRQFPWGNDTPSSSVANYDYIFGDTMAAAAFTQGGTPEGVLNLAGNVWEWVADTYAADYYSWSEGVDPQGPTEGPLKVVRGGSFGSGPLQLTGFNRSSYVMTDAYSNVGFRCAY